MSPSRSHIASHRITSHIRLLLRRGGGRRLRLLLGRLGLLGGLRRVALRSAAAHLGVVRGDAARLLELLARVEAALASVLVLRAHGSRLVLCAHIGRAVSWRLGLGDIERLRDWNGSDWMQCITLIRLLAPVRQCTKALERAQAMQCNHGQRYTNFRRSRAICSNSSLYLLKISSALARLQNTRTGTEAKCT